MTMLEALEITGDADLVEIEPDKAETRTDRVLVFIDHEDETIYLWRGSKASVFKKLNGTRVIARLSHKYPNYRIKPIAEGREPAAFKSLLERR
ncbi:MAG: hypothetical protein KGY80_05970 [Candidatus Thorarchaeota archaeon]|nr:hypothetical protein [Candidatus Thorarchaeota archaeon]